MWFISVLTHVVNCNELFNELNQLTKRVRVTSWEVWRVPKSYSDLFVTWFNSLNSSLQLNTWVSTKINHICFDLTYLFSLCTLLIIDYEFEISIHFRINSETFLCWSNHKWTLSEPIIPIYGPNYSHWVI